MWSPCCVLEGQATLAGEPMRLVLYANGFSGSFTTFGSCSFALLPAGQKANEPVSRDTLSSLIQYQGTFYRVNLAGTHAKDQTVKRDVPEGYDAHRPGSRRGQGKGGPQGPLEPYDDYRRDGPIRSPWCSGCSVGPPRRSIQAHLGHNQLRRAERWPVAGHVQ